MTPALVRNVSSLEKAIGTTATSGILGLVALALAGIYVRPAVVAKHLGTWYVKMAADPLSSPEYIVGHRILTPVISWALGLRGELMIITNLMFTVLLLGLVYHYFRVRFKNDPADALTALAIITFSMVTFSNIYYAGYTDALTYVIVFSMYRFRNNPWALYPLFLAGLLNRESILFLVPWYLFLVWQDRPSKARKILEPMVGFGAALLVYSVFRYWMMLLGDQYMGYDYYIVPVFKDLFYWIKQAYPYQGLGLFSVFKILWVIPALALHSMWRKKLRSGIASLLILAICTGAQLMIAFDSSRMWCMAFPVMIISLEYLYRSNEYQLRHWIGWLLVGNLLVPQLYTAFSMVEVMHSIPGRLFLMYLKGTGW